MGNEVTPLQLLREVVMYSPSLTMNVDHLVSVVCVTVFQVQQNLLVVRTCMWKLRA